MIDESKEDSEADQKEMECLELGQDIQELKRVYKYVRRSNVKKELNMIVERFESKLKKIKSPPEDPYKFPPTSSKDWPNLVINKSENEENDTNQVGNEDSDV